MSAKYPDLVYIANSVIRVVGRENDDKRKDIPNFVNPKNVKVFDEHYYNSIEWACEQHYRFDNYKRGVADLFIANWVLAENILITCWLPEPFVCQ